MIIALIKHISSQNQAVDTKEVLHFFLEPSQPKTQFDANVYKVLYQGMMISVCNDEHAPERKVQYRRKRSGSCSA
jgi:hypothetical protein